MSDDDDRAVFKAATNDAAKRIAWFYFKKQWAKENPVGAWLEAERLWRLENPGEAPILP